MQHIPNPRITRALKLDPAVCLGGKLATFPGAPPCPPLAEEELPLGLLRARKEKKITLFKVRLEDGTHFHVLWYFTHNS